MENRKQTYIAALALIVSVISLVITYINEYRENIEIVADDINIVSIDVDNNTIDCEIDIIVANTSQHTVPLLKYKAYKSYSSFKQSKELEVITEPEFPLTLISGGAEKILLKCVYKMDDDTLINIKNKKELFEILKKQCISVRIYTSKSSPYTVNARFKN